MKYISADDGFCLALIASATKQKVKERLASLLEGEALDVAKALLGKKSKQSSKVTAAAITEWARKNRK